MLTGPIQTLPPFDLPGLVWAGVALPPLTPDDDPRHMRGEGLRIDLPERLANAVPKRRREFLAGRLCAAHVLRRLDVPVDLPVRGRAPVWPDGIAGSISHSDHRAAAVASRAWRLAGLDLEPLVADDRAAQLAPAILRDDEAAQPAEMPFGSYFTLVFSAKEAFYKAVSAQVGRVLEFHEVRLAALDGTTLQLAFDGADHLLHWQIADGHCTTLMLA